MAQFILTPRTYNWRAMAIGAIIGCVLSLSTADMLDIDTGVFKIAEKIPQHDAPSGLMALCLAEGCYDLRADTYRLAYLQ